MMTKIPAKLGGQTWANYFIERLKERGADAYVELPAESGLKEEGNIIIHVGRQKNPEVILTLHYVWGMRFSQFPDSELKFTRINTPQYDGSGTIEINDIGECLVAFTDMDDVTVYRAKGALEGILSKDMPAEHTLCNLADFVKQRQDFYKQEEQK